MPRMMPKGLLYARVLVPCPPLVVVTNGADLHLLETHSGARWEPSERSEASFLALMARASQVASSDLKKAVDVDADKPIGLGPSSSPRYG